METALWPNITGIAPQFRGIYMEDATINGAFLDTLIQGFDSWGGGGSGSRVKHIFNASKSNKLYGLSTTVQPKSLTTLYIIKSW